MEDNRLQKKVYIDFVGVDLVKTLKALQLKLN